MARNKKVTINTNELTPTTLGIRKDKKKVSIFGIVWIVLIFAIFVGAVIYLPEISVYVNDYLNPEPTTPSSGNTTTDVVDDNTGDDTEVATYQISNTLEITKDNFKINNLSVNNGTLSLDIVNSTESIINFKDLDYFIELYDNNNTLLQRIMLKDEVVAPTSTSSFSYKLTSTSASIISLLEITRDEYPTHVVDINQNGVASLVCTKDYETVTYLLSDNKVYAILDAFKVPTSDSNFNTLYSGYQALQATYSTISGISSVLNINNSTNMLEFNNTISLTSLDTTTIDSNIIYEKDTDAKVMNFELESLGYTCN